LFATPTGKEFSADIFKSIDRAAAGSYGFLQLYSLNHKDLFALKGLNGNRGLQKLLIETGGQRQ
jgi:hypothetical protein